MKQWSEENPKADLMEQKRAAIVSAARRAFLDGGYSQTSMDGIAEAAEVSVKTIYRHFENKDELFSAVMQAVCGDNGIPSGEQNVAALAVRYPWFDDASERGLTAGGIEYLNHVLSNEQLSLYRVVTRDAHRFPELGLRYHREVLSGRTETFVKYVEHCAHANKWKLKNPRIAGSVFETLLRAGIFEELLHGIRVFEKRDVVAHSRTVASAMWNILQTQVL